MYCYRYELQFIYNSIYESLSKDCKHYNTQYWKLVLRKLNPKHYVLVGDGVLCVCTLAFLDGYFSRWGFCDPAKLLEGTRPSENPEWCDRVALDIGRFSMTEKRDLLRILTESPVYGVFVRNQLA